jgi:hypothetical protein
MRCCCFDTAVHGPRLHTWWRPNPRRGVIQSSGIGAGWCVAYCTYLGALDPSLSRESPHMHAYRAVDFVNIGVDAVISDVRVLRLLRRRNCVGGWTHKLGWRDLYDAAVRWRHVAEPNEATFYVDFLEDESVAMQAAFITEQHATHKFVPAVRFYL